MDWRSWERENDTQRGYWEMVGKDHMMLDKVQRGVGKDRMMGGRIRMMVEENRMSRRGDGRWVMEYRRGEESH